MGRMTWLANAVLVLHALIVVFIVGGLIAIWIGAALRHEWARHRGFRVLHLAAIGIVAILAALDVPCPLTVLEDRLRTGAAGEQGFVQHWVSAWLYYDLPGWVFAAAYVAFLLIVAQTWRRVPPRPKSRSHS
jgi:preprotein translocase subunit SecY